MSIGQARADALPTRVRAVVENVCDRLGIPIEIVLSDDVTHAVSRVRRAAIAALREMTWGGGPPSFGQIGRWIGRDHTTVMWSLKGAEGRKKDGKTYPPPRTDAPA